MEQTVVSGSEGIMRIGIDASNIRAGGGVTHLRELLLAAQPELLGVREVTIWGCSEILSLLPERKWLNKVSDPLLDSNFCQRVWWQRYRLQNMASLACDILFAPGGLHFGSFRPLVVMAQNLLPFDKKEWRRYGVSRNTFRFWLLRRAFAANLRSADGAVFLTEASRAIIKQAVGGIPGRTIVIPHGVCDTFRNLPRQQLPIEAFSWERPFRLLYVSGLFLYKHQWHVAEAVMKLRKQGIPAVLDLVGPAEPRALERLRATLKCLDGAEQSIRYLGPLPYEILASCYITADAFVFASSCETFSMILMEAMAAGLPIACSNVPPMPEVAGPDATYFNPEDPAEIAAALLSLMKSSAIRTRNARSAYDRARGHSWERCAYDTFSFLVAVAKAKNSSLRRGKLDPNQASST